jgi:hypothetical protein
MQAYELQEGSGCWHCQFINWGNSAFGLDICAGGTDPGCQNSSFQDIYAIASTSSNVCTTGALGIRVNSPSETGPKFIKGLTVDATGCSSGNPYTGIRFASNQTSLEDVLVKGTTVGLRVGPSGATANSVTINGVQSSGLVDNSHAPFCNATTDYQGPTTVLLDASQVGPTSATITNGTLLSISDIYPHTATDLLYNCFQNTSAFQVPCSVSNNNCGLAQYTVKGNGTVVYNTNKMTSTSSSAPAITTLDLGLSNVQQYSCGGNGTVTLAVANLEPGAQMTFIFVQNATSPACTLTYPSNMHGATAPSSTPSSVTTQQYVVSNDGTDLYAVAPGSTCLSSCGTP